MQLRIEKDLKEKETKWEMHWNTLKQQLDEVTNERNHLATAKLQLETELRGVISQLQSAQLETKRYVQYVTRYDHDSLREEGLKEAKFKVESLEQQMQSKTDVIVQMSNTLEAMRQQRAQLEETTEMHKATVHNLQEKSNLLQQELKKANQLIQIFQNKYKVCKSQLKSDRDDKVKQDKMLLDKQQQLEKYSQVKSKSYFFNMCRN